MNCTILALEEGAVGNWCRDQMHGVANVERGGFYHLRVIYKNDESKMPFSDTGPPATGFDGHVLGPVVHKVVKRSSKQPKAAASSDYDVDFKQISSKPPFRKSVNIKADRYERQKITQEKAASVHVIHEPTDFLPHEHDVLVRGGTGENAVMNGIYFRLSHVFGSPQYKHYHGNQVRYMFRNELHTQWVIHTAPAEIAEVTPGTAWAQASCENPGDIVGAWRVYHMGRNRQAKYKPYSAVGAEDTPIDQITVKVRWWVDSHRD